MSRIYAVEWESTIQWHGTKAEAEAHFQALVREGWEPFIELTDLKRIYRRAIGAEE